MLDYLLFGFIGLLGMVYGVLRLRSDLPASRMQLPPLLFQRSRDPIKTERWFYGCFWIFTGLIVFLLPFLYHI